jgi:uncharacterized DUF497 family protein
VYARSSANANQQGDDDGTASDLGQEAQEETATMEDEFEWDPVKAAENLEKHKVSFETAIHIFAGPIIEGLDDREDYGEDRFITLGAVDNRVLVVVYTWRDGRRRIISARKATRDERQEYGAALARDGPTED